MEKIGIETVILLFGIVILAIGLFGRLETKWFKVGSDSYLIRILAFFIGVALVVISIIANKNIFTDNELQKQIPDEQQITSSVSDKENELQEQLQSKSDELTERIKEIDLIKKELRMAEIEKERLKDEIASLKPKIRVKGTWNMIANNIEIIMRIKEQENRLLIGESVDTNNSNFAYVWGSISGQDIEFKRVARPNGTVQVYSGTISSNGNEMEGNYCHGENCAYTWTAERKNID